MKRYLLSAVLAAFAFAAATPTRADVIAHWSFDEMKSGVFKDDTGKHDAKVMDQNLVLPHPGLDAPFGKAVMLTGSDNSYLEIPGFTEIQQTSLTVAAWVNFSGAGPSFIIADWASTPEAGMVFGIDPLGPNKSTAQPIADLASPTTAGRGRNRISVIRQALPNNPIPLFSWHHVAWTWDRDNTKITFYLDGNQVVETPKRGNNPRSLDLATNRRPLRIGSRQMPQANSSSPVNFVGSLDELWIFNTALNSEQINNLKNINSITPRPVVAANTNTSVTPTPVTPTPVAPAPVKPVQLTPVQATPPPTPGNTSAATDAPTLAQTRAPGKYSGGKLVGIVTCLLAEVVLISYLTWAFKARARLRAG